MLVTETEVIKLRSNGYLYPVETWLEGSRRYFRFSFNRPLMNEIKNMAGAKWNPDRKLWSADESQRNNFQLSYLKGENPYKDYDSKLDLSQIPVRRFNKRSNCEFELYAHQREGTAHIIQRRNSIIAGEMGTGKSLMMGLAIEHEANWYENTTCWYVGPRSAIAAVQRDFEIWGVRPYPNEWLTYESLTSKMKKWTGGRAPRLLFCDEGSKLKTPTSQRSQAARALADGVRSDWGVSGLVSLLSGTPAPKSPADWWSLAEIACPGFLLEGDIFKFQRRLGIIVQKEGVDGGTYPRLIAWRDDVSRCNTCGEKKDHPSHSQIPELMGVDPSIHAFVESKNEVQQLYHRLKGLTVVFFKKDCLSLPEKIYRPIDIPPSKATLAVAKVIAKTARSTIQGLTLLRELSDGFQYVETPIGQDECSICKGSTKIKHVKDIEGTCPNCTGKDESFICGKHTPQTVDSEISCMNCNGVGTVTKFERKIKEVSSPKDAVLEDLLDEFEETGRVVIYAGFTGSIDRVVGICKRQGWAVIRMDQGKTQIIDAKGVPLDVEFQSLFQDRLTDFPKVAFVAHTESAGMGLTLTASPVVIYFSNTFSGEAREQSEDRIHRPGMDTNKGATIIDLLHLPSDLKVLENLKKKKVLMKMSLGDFIDN